MLTLPIVLQDLLVLLLISVAGWLLIRRFRRSGRRPGASCPACGRSRADL